MKRFLRDNQPWASLIRQENVVLRDLVPGQAAALGSGVRVVPVPVPQRRGDPLGRGKLLSQLFIIRRHHEAVDGRLGENRHNARRHQQHRYFHRALRHLRHQRQPERQYHVRKPLVGFEHHVAARILHQ